MKDVQKDKRIARVARHRRVRRVVRGTSERPRLSVFRSLNHIYAQIVNDETGETVVSASSLKMAPPSAEQPESGSGGTGKGKPESTKIRRSRYVGTVIAEAALGRGIKKVMFDRGGYLYHGRVAVLADAARKTGLEF